MARDKKKKKAAAAAKKAAAAEQGTVKQGKKGKRNSKRDGELPEEEEDIDAILTAFKEAQEAKFRVTEESNCPPPPRRANASLFVNPLNTSELVLFGGEYFDGQRVHMFNDLYRFSLDKCEWKRVTSPHSPGPRSSHQLAIFPNGRLFLFGGEFVSPKETSFFHYKDFWSLDLHDNQWEKIEMKGAQRPSPRSGHRMAVWKHLAFLYGGFVDTGRDTKYLDDLWVFNSNEYTWMRLDGLPEPRPSARSGFQFFTLGDTICLVGGYCKQVVKGGKTKGMVLDDIWHLKVSLPEPLVAADGSEVMDLSKCARWERKKRAGGIPPGLRSGATITTYKNRGIMFGGIADILESDESIESVCFGDMFQYVSDTNKWYPQTIREPKKPKNGNLAQEKPSIEDQVSGQADHDEEDESRVDNTAASVDPITPCPRFSAMTAVANKNRLYVYGGIIEEGERELTLNDLWSINLEKLDGWECLITDEVHTAQWLGESSSSESEDEVIDGDEEDEDEKEDDDDSYEDVSSANPISLDGDSDGDEEDRAIDMDDIEARLQALNVTPDLHPLCTEKLQQFYDRTGLTWQGRALDLVNKRGKALRRSAFDMAKEVFDLMQPQLAEMRALVQAEEEEIQQRKVSAVSKAKEHLDTRNRR